MSRIVIVILFQFQHVMDACDLENCLRYLLWCDSFSSLGPTSASTSVYDSVFFRFLTSILKRIRRNVQNIKTA
jgi:hypothetical protein